MDGGFVLYFSRRIHVRGLLQEPMFTALFTCISSVQPSPAMRCSRIRLSDVAHKHIVTNSTVSHRDLVTDVEGVTSTFSCPSVHVRTELVLVHVVGLTPAYALAERGVISNTRSPEERWRLRESSSGTVAAVLAGYREGGVLGRVFVVDGICRGNLEAVEV